MKKQKTRLLAFLMAAALTLSACSSGTPGGNDGPGNNDGPGSNDGPSGGSGNPVTDLIVYETPVRDVENLLIQNTEQAKDHNFISNFTTPLLEIDNKGNLVPALAESWGTDDDGLTWTFHLRQGVKWVDMNGNEKAECTAQDFITGLEWVLNFQKNGANNVSMPRNLIVGAEDYYNYTVDMSEAEGKALDTTKFLEMVGIEVPDDYTVVYHCPTNVTYFDTLAICACLFPLAQGLIDEVGVDNMVGISYTDLWYNGPYTCTEYIQGNQYVLTKNPTYWDTSCTLFDTVTLRIVDDVVMAYQLYTTGEMDFVELNQSTLDTIYKEGESNEWYKYLVETQPRKYSYQFHFNFDKYNQDNTPDVNWNTAVANEAFRQSLYYGMDLESYWARTNAINPLKCENLAYTMPGLLYFSDGTDYAHRVMEKLGFSTEVGTSSRRYNADKAEQYKQQAIEELTAQGVTFPVVIDWWISSGNQTATDGANTLKQLIEQGLGADYVTLNINTYVSSATKEVYSPGYHSIVSSGWGADYGDVENFLGQEIYGEKGAYYSQNYSRINNVTAADAPELIATYEQYSQMVKDAQAVVDDKDARYEAFADAEAYLLEHALTIPALYEISWQLTNINDYSKMRALYGSMNYYYKNWQTSLDGYTTADYDQFAAAYNG